MAECKFNTLISSIQYPDPLSFVTASRGIFIWLLVKLKKCHVSINPSKPSLSNTFVTVARAFIGLSTRHLDTSDCRFTWLHQCSHCGRELEFTTAYPLLEVVKRTFMLEDARPAPLVEKGGMSFKWYLRQG